MAVMHVSFLDLALAFVLSVPLTMSSRNAEWFSRNVLLKATSVQDVDRYFTKLRQLSNTVAGRTLTEDEAKASLAECRLHFGVGPRGGKSKATKSRLLQRKGRSDVEEGFHRLVENERVKASKIASKKRKLAATATKQAALSATPMAIERRTRAELLGRIVPLGLPQSLKYEIMRKGQDVSKLGLVLALVDDFVKERGSLRDPVGWLRRGLYNLREGAPPPVP